MNLISLFNLKSQNDPRTWQIFGERIVHFFTLKTLTKQTTLCLKKTTPLSFILYHKKGLAELFNGYFMDRLCIKLTLTMSRFMTQVKIQ